MYSSVNVFVSLGFIMGGVVEKYIGPRMSVFIGGWMGAVGLCLSYLTIDVSFWLLMVSYGALYSFGIGLVLAVTILCVIRWLPKWAGFASGFVVSANGAGTLVFTAYQTALINPSNLFPDYSPYPENPDEMYFSQSELLDSVPLSFLYQGIIFMFLTSVFCIVLVNPTPATDEREANDHLQQKSAPLSKHSVTGLSTLQACLTLDFYLIILISGINVAVYSVIISLYKTFGLEVVRTSDYFLTVTGIVVGITGIIGRIGFGLLADRTSHKLAFVLQSAFFAIFVLTLYTTALELAAMYLIWISSIALLFGGYVPVFGVAVLKCFGERYFNFNYSLFYLSPAVGGIISGFISDYCLDLFGWYGTFIFLGVLSILQLICSLFLTDKPTSTEQYTTHIYNVINLEILHGV